MAEDYYLTTPEAITIEYDVAGIGTRFLAAFVDFLVWLVVQIAVFIGALALYSLGGVARSTALILGLTLSFILFWGYFIVFETVWSGQTPGKRALKIRVIRTSGYPIGFLDVVIRNLIRLVDFLPGFYGLGILVMFISPQARRLGDYAAGTIVVKERIPVPLSDVAGRSTPIGAPAYPEHSTPSRGAIDPDELQWNLAAVTQADLTVVNRFLDRAPTLPAEARRRIGDRIAGRIAGQIGAREPLDPVRFLQRVVFLSENE